MIEEFAKQHGFDVTVTESMIAGTIRELNKMYDGDTNRMVADIQESPDVVEVALRSYMKAVRRMTTIALTREKEFTHYVYQLLVNGS